MPIGGVKEKILAAKRNKVSHIILPLKNKPDLLGMEDITEMASMSFGLIMPIEVMDQSVVKSVKNVKRFGIIKV